MIDYISGKLADKSPVKAVIESFGVGWDLSVALSTYEKLPAVGQDCKLYTMLHYTQDGAKLYGFVSTVERELFQMLISVSGIGPKIAMSVISTMSTSSILRSIRNAEEHLLIKVPGLGKKSAQRLIVELRDKIDRIAGKTEEDTQIQPDDKSMELETALISLGFNLRDIRRELSLMRADGLDLPLEQMIKETIKRLYQRSR